MVAFDVKDVELPVIVKVALGVVEQMYTVTVTLAVCPGLRVIVEFE